MDLLKRIAWTVTLFISTGCGDALVPDTYRGPPLLSFQGVVFDGATLNGVAPQNLRGSIFWSKTAQTSTRPEALVEQRAIEVSAEFPATFTVNLFEGPNAPQLAVDEGPFELGQLLFYEDRNDNNTFDQGELLGGAPLNAVLFLPRDLDEATSPTDAALGAGAHLVELPLTCGVQLPTSTATRSRCGANLGEACTKDQDCGARGRCLTDMQGGYCALPLSSGCTPQDGANFPVSFSETEEPELDSFVWLKGCTQDSDCRTQEGYGCERRLDGCIPRNPILIELGTNYAPVPLCL